MKSIELFAQLGRNPLSGGESRAVHCHEEHLAKLRCIYSYPQLRREDEKETRCIFEVVIYMIQFLNKTLKI